MKPLDEVNWGIIGCGNVTEVKSGPAFNLVNHSHLKAVMGRNETKAKDFACRHQVDKWYSNAKELINDPAVNAVYIATPPDTHAQYAIESINVGKAVYVEKPMARTYSECLQMIKASEEADVPLFVAYYRRSLPYYIKLKTILDLGLIGDIEKIDLKLFNPPKQDDYNQSNLPWRVKPEISGGGYFYDLASHQLDILDFLFGEIVNVTAFAENRAGLYRAEDFVKTVLEFENGVKAFGEWNFGVHPDEYCDETRIEGQKGTLVFSFFSGQPIILQRKIFREVYRIKNPIHIQLPHIQNIVNELRGTGKCPSYQRTSANTNKVMEEVVRDYYTMLSA